MVEAVCASVNTTSTPTGTPGTPEPRLKTSTVEPTFFILQLPDRRWSLAF